METVSRQLSICSFNCRGVKSSLPKVQKLCEMHDTVMKRLWICVLKLLLFSVSLMQFIY